MRAVAPPVQSFAMGRAGSSRQAHRPMATLDPSHAWPTPTWMSFPCASGETCSAGRSTRSARSRCSTPTCRRAATSSTRPTPTGAAARGQAGESERIIGRWMAARGNRDRLVIATKVGMSAGSAGAVARTTIRRGIEGSLERLGVDTVDLYYAHRDDPGHAARGDAGRLRCAGRRGQDPLRGRLELQRRAPAARRCGSASARGWPATSPCSRTTT